MGLSTRELRSWTTFHLQADILNTTYKCYHCRKFKPFFKIVIELYLWI